MNYLKLTTAALFTAALLLSGAALAQQPPAAAAPDTEVSDRELNAFLDARESIAAIQQDYSQRLENTQEPEKANELQQAANEEMIQAVEDSGLDVERFNTIVMAIQNDPELQRKLQEQIGGSGR
ncbi:DUF4168 domain-containing protein [Wenzhouxiangella sp. XN79A]|uniref:DUF4168 domain-containing protein n=1 Tax=Wenzhouxiangella sp. XN79A TaxID=2724193 RepID=UPI00144A8F8D|nr:DUF4168 domain-containing protein [Wenzhouxiangella sp. XN79A]NKI34622.1 DUF4168 domain-containing protein [Wenzhouxiangella sp. XN79A]